MYFILKPLSLCSNSTIFEIIYTGQKLDIGKVGQGHLILSYKNTGLAEM